MKVKIQRRVFKYMERSITRLIKEWYEQNEGEILCIVGGPYVGKSYIVRNFCGSIKEKDILFVDNIDSYENLLKAKEVIYKGWIEGKRIIIAGRLTDKNCYTCLKKIQIKYKIIKMYPMTFDEFYHIAILNRLLERLSMYGNLDKTDLLKAYMVVGGLPDCVKLFFDTGNLTYVREYQSQIIIRLIKEISDNSKTMKKRLRKLLDSIGEQSMDEGAGFSYRAISKDARERDYGEALELLIKIGVVYKIERMGVPERDVIRNFKLAIYDVGIYGMLANINERKIMCEYDVPQRVYKKIYIHQELMSMDICSDISIWYWHKQRAKAKIDLILKVNNGDGEKMYAFWMNNNTIKRSKCIESFLKEYPKAEPICVIINNYGEYILQKI